MVCYGQAQMHTDYQQREKEITASAREDEWGTEKWPKSKTTGQHLITQKDPQSHGKTKPQLSHTHDETEQGKAEGEEACLGAGQGRGRQSGETKVDGGVPTAPPAFHLDPPQGGGPKPEPEINFSGRKRKGCWNREPPKHEQQ